MRVRFELVLKALVEAGLHKRIRDLKLSAVPLLECRDQLLLDHINLALVVRQVDLHLL